MSLKNADSIVKMYFEADRSAVKQRYDSIFGVNREDDEGDESANADLSTEDDSAPDVPEGDDSDKGDRFADAAELDAEFDELIALSGTTDEVLEPLRARWKCLHPDDKFLGLHYLGCLWAPDWTFEHGLEGVIQVFHVWDASKFLHAINPALSFPIDGALSYLRLRSIFDVLGIEFDDSKNLSEYEVWLNLSTAVSEWATERKFEPWQAWAAVYDLGPRLLESPPPYPVERDPRVWIIATNDAFDEFEQIDQHGTESVGAWAINKGAKRGDLALMYCVRPRSAIVSVYRVLEDAHRDPFGGWNGFRGEVGEKIGLPWITLADMRNDPVLSQWKLVRGNFQGLLKHEVPENVWDRIKEIAAAADSATGEM